MALVMLPCDLPFWCNLQKHLSHLSRVNNVEQFIEGMVNIHNMCNGSTGLDPDEPLNSDPTLFTQLENFLKNLDTDEKFNFYHNVLPIMAKRALQLKTLKPINGFHFSLQQQGDERAYSRAFLASLLAHSFFSTFPKRTCKTHPTLQDFNFTSFFKFLDQSCQQAKLKSIFHYFELLESVIDENECVTYSRQVMGWKQRLTMDDWVQSCLPLCPLAVRNDGSLADVEPQALRICFSSSKIGGSVLREGTSQESIQFATIPELICILASVEALEDNEVFLINNVCQISKISQPRQKALLEKFTQPTRVCLCCMDAKNYVTMPLDQLQENNVLRELNKALLGFCQGKLIPVTKICPKTPAFRRLTPIGESFSSTTGDNPQTKDKPLSSTSSHVGYECSGRNRCCIIGFKKDVGIGSELGHEEKEKENLVFVSQNEREEDEEDDEDIFHSAQTSLDLSEKEEFDSVEKNKNCKRRSKKLRNSSFSLEDERQFSFSERLKKALLRGTSISTGTGTGTGTDTGSGESSNVEGSSISSSIEECNQIRCKRETSTGFILQEQWPDDEDEDLRRHLTDQQILQGGNRSDKYSFLSDETDLDISNEVSRLINVDVDIGDSSKEDSTRDVESLISLKRALSDTKAVVKEPFPDNKKGGLTARSFSLELAKHNPELAAQILYLLSKQQLTGKSMAPNENGQKPVATGNWGCGSCNEGDPQLKLTIQWLAASYTGLPNLIYYTCRHHKLVKLDTVRRILVDRGWTVGQLTNSLLQYAQMSIGDSHSPTLFDSLITSVHG